MLSERRVYILACTGRSVIQDETIRPDDGLLRQRLREPAERL